MDHCTTTLKDEEHQCEEEHASCRRRSLSQAPQELWRGPCAGERRAFRHGLLAEAASDLGLCSQLRVQVRFSAPAGEWATGLSEDQPKGRFGQCRGQQGAWEREINL